MRKNRMMRLASTLLVLTLLTTSAVSGTFAKYTSEATASDTARVAKWSFKVGETDIATSDSFTFELFKTIKDSDLTSAETDVAAAQLVAPGTSGSFDIVLKNESEVSAKYAIDYTITNAESIPIEYTVDNGTTWTTDLTDVAAHDTDTKLAANGGTTTITVQWRWAYEGSGSTNFTASQTDDTDTTLGIAGAATVKVEAKITATQID